MFRRVVGLCSHHLGLRSLDSRATSETFGATPNHAKKHKKDATIDEEHDFVATAPKAKKSGA